MAPLRDTAIIYTNKHTQACIYTELSYIGSKLIHADPLPSVSSGADAKPSSVQPAKRKTPLYCMKVLLDLKKVTESSEEPEKLPHIPTLKEWVRQEKRKEREEEKKAKKAMKIKEKQLKKELKQEQKATGNCYYYSDHTVYLLQKVSIGTSTKMDQLGLR